VREREKKEKRKREGDILQERDVKGPGYKHAHEGKRKKERERLLH
jgi:hypothetical protein